MDVQIYLSAPTHSPVASTSGPQSKIVKKTESQVSSKVAGNWPYRGVRRSGNNRELAVSVGAEVRRGVHARATTSRVHILVHVAVLVFLSLASSCLGQLSQRSRSPKGMIDDE